MWVRDRDQCRNIGLSHWALYELVIGSGICRGKKKNRAGQKSSGTRQCGQLLVRGLTSDLHSYPCRSRYLPAAVWDGSGPSDTHSIPNPLPFLSPAVTLKARGRRRRPWSATSHPMPLPAPSNQGRKKRAGKKWKGRGKAKKGYSKYGAHSSHANHFYLPQKKLSLWAPPPLRRPHA